MSVWNPEVRNRGVAMFWRWGIDISLRSFVRSYVDVDVIEEDDGVWIVT